MNAPGSFPQRAPWAAPRVPLIIDAPRQHPWVEHYGLMLVLGLLTLVYLNVPGFLYQTDSRILPKYFHYAGVLLLAPLFMARLARLKALLVTPMALWAWACIGLYFAHLFVAIGQADEVRVEQIKGGIQYLVLMLLYASTVAMVPAARYERLFPILLAAAAGTIVFDFISPGTLYTFGEVGTLGRPAGVYLNPNRAAEIVIILLLLALPVIRRSLRLPVAIAVATVVALTLSRAGIAWIVIVLLYFAATRVLPRVAMLVIVACLAATPLLGGWILDYAADRPELTDGLENMRERLDFFGTRDLSDSSSMERAAVFQNGLELFLANPIFGAGAGTTEAADGRLEYPHAVGTHNTPVMLMAEYGVFGAVSWLALCWLVWRGRYFAERPIQLAAFGSVVVLSMFTHNLLYDALHWLLAIALFAMRPQASDAHPPVAGTVLSRR